jgi:hypothetical protein
MNLVILAGVALSRGFQIIYPSSLGQIHAPLILAPLYLSGFLFLGQIVQRWTIAFWHSNSSNMLRIHQCCTSHSLLAGGFKYSSTSSFVRVERAGNAKPIRLRPETYTILLAIGVGTSLLPKGQTYLPQVHKSTSLAHSNQQLTEMYETFRPLNLVLGGFIFGECDRLFQVRFAQSPTAGLCPSQGVPAPGAFAIVK